MRQVATGRSPASKEWLPWAEPPPPHSAPTAPPLVRERPASRSPLVGRIAVPSQVATDVFAKRPSGPGDQLAGDLARLVAEDLGGAIVRLPRRFGGVRRAGEGHSAPFEPREARAPADFADGSRPATGGLRPRRRKTRRRQRQKQRTALTSATSGLALQLPRSYVDSSYIGWPPGAAHQHMCHGPNAGGRPNVTEAAYLRTRMFKRRRKVVQDRKLGQDSGLTGCRTPHRIARPVLQHALPKPGHLTPWRTSTA